MPDVTLYSPKGSKVKAPGSKAAYYEGLGYSRERPGKKSRKPPKTEEGSNNGENQG